MRVENWESKLNNYIEQTNKKSKFKYGKNDCITFVLKGIEIITDRKIFDHKWKSIKDGRDLINKFKKNDLLGIALLVGKENNFKQIDIHYAQRGDVVYHKNIKKSDLDGSLGICLGSSSLFNWSKGMTFKPTLDCKIAWRIE
tara:strand:- start:5984 stop:6409 length:426 start_codon:yes stop_codon:yes gene_type:complete